MTAADVNVPELLARAVHRHMQRVRDRGDYIVGPASDEAATDALAALRSPEVVAGIAGVLWRAERRPEANAPESWDAAVVEAEQWPDGYWAVQVRRIRTRARAVVEWLTGGWAVSGRWRVERVPGDILGWWRAVHPSGRWAWIKPTWREAFDCADREVRR